VKRYINDEVFMSLLASLFVACLKSKHVLVRVRLLVQKRLRVCTSTLATVTRTASVRKLLASKKAG